MVSWEKESFHATRIKWDHGRLSMAAHHADMGLSYGSMIEQYHHCIERFTLHSILPYWPYQNTEQIESALIWHTLGHYMSEMNGIHMYCRHVAFDSYYSIGKVPRESLCTTINNLCIAM